MIKINIVEVKILLGDLPCASQVIHSYKAPKSYARLNQKLIQFPTVACLAHFFHTVSNWFDMYCDKAI